jgi:hypothetical protein
MGISSQSDAPTVLPHRKGIPEPTVKKLGGARAIVGVFGEQINLLPLLGI